MDATIEQSLDDAYKGIKVSFYLSNIIYNETGNFKYDSYRLVMKGRDNTWYLQRTYSDGSPNDLLASGSYPVSVGIDYHIRIEVEDNNIKAFFNQVGDPLNLLIETEVSNNPLYSGKIGIGGADDRISVDNIFVDCMPCYFYDDFNDDNYESWDFYKYSSGLHGPVLDPDVVEGRLEITTHDQQGTLLVNGDIFALYKASARI